MKVPGSISSALAIRYLVSADPSSPGRGTNDHLGPVGKPAPPRPRSFESVTSSWTSPGVRSLSAFLRAR